MKKTLLLFGIFVFFCSVSSASNYKNNQKMFIAFDCKCKNKSQDERQENSCNKENFYQKNKIEKRMLEIEDDEYYTYNQCFFDKRFREMKLYLGLTQRQESCFDDIYLNFKTDMEKIYLRYCSQRDEVLRSIQCDCASQEQKRCLKEIEKEAKEKYKDFKEELEDQLCKNQKNGFRKFQREEKRKIKRIAKYCKVYKFPCLNCCSN